VRIADNSLFQNRRAPIRATGRLGTLNQIYVSRSGRDVGAVPTVITGRPDPEHISTSYVERQNWSVRTSMRRYTRLSNDFSRKIENHRSGPRQTTGTETRPDSTSATLDPALGQYGLQDIRPALRLQQVVKFCRPKENSLS
jgi:hypothetical protein